MPPEPVPEPPTPAEVEAARRLGVPLELYRQFKRNAGPAAERLEKGDGPADVVAEQQLADKMRRQPGLFKRQNTAPNIFVQAAETPGEVAKTLLTIFCYVVLMFGSLIFYGVEKAQRIPGIFQMVILGLLVIPALMLSSFIWEHIGEGARDVCRALVRFWPLTLVGLIFLFGMLKMLLQQH
jgi:hypothetical protein